MDEGVVLPHQYCKHIFRHNKTILPTNSNQTNCNEVFIPYLYFGGCHRSPQLCTYDHRVGAGTNQSTRRSSLLCPPLSNDKHTGISFRLSTGFPFKSPPSSCIWCTIASSSCDARGSADLRNAQVKLAHDRLPWHSVHHRMWYRTSYKWHIIASSGLGSVACAIHHMVPGILILL